jgi:glucosylceramidase
MIKNVFTFLFVFLAFTTSAQVVSDKTLVQVYTTAKNTTQRIEKTNELTFVNLKQPLETQNCVFVYPAKKQQTFLGIGGAITDASAEVFAKLPPARQTEFLNAYYSKTLGIGYTLARTNINSCDFSSDMYTYIKEGDATLKSFDISHDTLYKIPLIKKAMATAGNLNLYASPWSPPAFMKTNNDVLHGGSLQPKYYQTWANYFVKFIQAYKQVGVPVWGVTIQNEPMATQRWESCIFTAEMERDFLKNNLGPTFQKNGLSNVKINVWDHNRDLLPQRVNTILEDANAAKYVWGIGFHWYENWSGGDMMYENVGKVHSLYPNKNLLFTEGCAEAFNADKYQNWANGEKYGKSMINDFNNGTVGWTDWNILLDETGGPNHVSNFCFAPVHANTKTGELIYTPSYYYIGHFSKFIQQGAKFIASAVSRSQLISTSFQNPNGQMVTVVMNQTDNEQTYFLCINEKACEVTIAPNAIETLVY